MMHHWISKCKKSILSGCFLVLISLFANPAFGDQILATGQISSFVASGASNYSFRVTIIGSGVNKLSGCTYNFAYLNKYDDDNYDAKVALLMSVQAQNRLITVTIDRNAGWCRLTDIAMPMQ